MDEIFGGLKQKGQEVAQGLVAFNKGLIPPEALLNMISQLLMVVLSPAEFDMVKKQAEGQMGGGAGMSSQPGMANAPRGDARPNATSAGVP